MKATVLVRPKAGILDPQGEAVQTGLGHLGFTGVRKAHVGRLVELELDATDPVQARNEIAAMCDQLIANPLIEIIERLRDGPAHVDRDQRAEAGDIALRPVGDLALGLLLLLRCRALGLGLLRTRGAVLFGLAAEFDDALPDLLDEAAEVRAHRVDDLRRPAQRIAHVLHHALHELVEIAPEIRELVRRVLEVRFRLGVGLRIEREARGGLVAAEELVERGEGLVGALCRILGGIGGGFASGAAFLLLATGLELVLLRRARARDRRLRAAATGGGLRSEDLIERAIESVVEFVFGLGL